MSDAPKRIWAWYYTEDKRDDIIKGGWNDAPDRRETEYVRADVLRNPTDEQVRSACLSYRHDFGLLSPKEQASVEFQAREWLHAWGKVVLG